MIIMILSIKLRNCGNPNENLQNMSADKKRSNVSPKLAKEPDTAAKYNITPQNIKYKPTKADKEYDDRQVQIKKQSDDLLVKWGTIIVGGMVLLYILLS